MVFTAAGLLVGSKTLRRRRHEPERGDRQAPRRVDARGRPLRRRSPHRPARAPRRARVPARLLGIGLPLTIVRRVPRRAARVRHAGLARGAPPRRHPGADRRRARAVGGDASEPPVAHPPGPERRERPQRRDLRAHLLRGPRDRHGRGRDRHRRPRVPPLRRGRSGTASCSASPPALSPRASSSSRGRGGSSRRRGCRLCRSQARRSPSRPPTPWAARASWRRSSAGWCSAPSGGGGAARWATCWRSSARSSVRPPSSCSAGRCSSRRSTISPGRSADTP